MTPRTLLLERLAQALEQVLVGRLQIRHQRELISQMEVSGQETAEARAILAGLEGLNALHEIQHARLAVKLAEMNANANRP